MRLITCGGIFFCSQLNLTFLFQIFSLQIRARVERVSRDGRPFNLDPASRDDQADVAFRSERSGFLPDRNLRRNRTRTRICRRHQRGRRRKAQTGFGKCKFFNFFSMSTLMFSKLCLSLFSMSTLTFSKLCLSVFSMSKLTFSKLF